MGVDGRVGGAAGRPRQRHGRGAQPLAPDEQLRRRADERGVAAAGAVDEARLEAGPQHAEHGRRVVRRRRVHGHLAREHDLLERAGADPLDRARDGGLPSQRDGSSAGRAALDAIECGTFAVGDQLPSEATLIRDLEVSRPVVREALRALQALGITVSRTGRGTFVVSTIPPTTRDSATTPPRDLIEARRHVEVPAAGYAAGRHTPDDLDTRTELLERMEHETDNTVWVALDSLFHIAIAHASANPVFGKVIEEIRDALARQSALLNQLDGRRDASNAEHRRIVDAIASGSSDAATEAMTVHLDHVDDAVTDIVG